MEQNNTRPEREQSRAQGNRRGSTARSNGGNSGREKNTRSYKHVQLDHQRPHLTKDGQQQGGQQKQACGQQGTRRSFTSPKKDPNATLRVIPLGGLDAIGKNMTVFECKGDMILDDAGLMFPDDDHPGIDLILPD